MRFSPEMTWKFALEFLAIEVLVLLELYRNNDGHFDHPQCFHGNNGRNSMNWYGKQVQEPESGLEIFATDFPALNASSLLCCG